MTSSNNLQHAVSTTCSQDPAYAVTTTTVNNCNLAPAALQHHSIGNVFRISAEKPATAPVTVDTVAKQHSGSLSECSSLSESLSLTAGLISITDNGHASPVRTVRLVVPASSTAVSPSPQKQQQQLLFTLHAQQAAAQQQAAVQQQQLFFALGPQQQQQQQHAALMSAPGVVRRQQQQQLQPQMLQHMLMACGSYQQQQQQQHVLMPLAQYSNTAAAAVSDQWPRHLSNVAAPGVATPPDLNHDIITHKAVHEQLSAAYASGYTDGAEAFIRQRGHAQQQQQQKRRRNDAATLPTSKRPRADTSSPPVAAATQPQQQQQEVQRAMTASPCIAAVLTGSAAAVAAVDMQSAAHELQHMSDDELLRLATAVVSTPVDRLLICSTVSEQQQQQHVAAVLSSSKELLAANPARCIPGPCVESQHTAVATAAAAAALENTSADSTAAAVTGGAESACNINIGPNITHVQHHDQTADLLVSLDQQQTGISWPCGMQAYPMFDDGDLSFMELASWLDV